MAGENEPVLRVVDLHVHFITEESLTIAVDGVSFELRRGESLGIVGESGSGKTVTALSIMKLLPIPPAFIPRGRIEFHSEVLGGKVDLLREPEKRLRRVRGKEIAMVFQEPMTSLNPVFRCGEQVDEAILTHEDVSSKEAKERTLQLFELVKLPDPERIYNSYPHQLSGGQKQRVMIAMALSCNPKILIADEPTTALDVTVQAAILKLLRDLQKQLNLSLIFISHDLGVVSEVCDRVIVMYRGKIVEDNDIRSIFLSPQHPYTRGLIACRPPLDIKLRSLPTLRDFVEEEPDGTMRDKKVTIQQVIEERIIPEEELQRRIETLTSQEPLLKVENLKKYFVARRSLLGKPLKVVKAVDDVSFEVYPGETLGLVGESGSGKTTLGRTILRLIEADGGKVMYNGKNILELSSGEMRTLRKEMQIIFQDPFSSLNPRLTVGYAITEPMRVHGIYNSEAERRDAAMELLEKVALKPEHYYRYPHEFSGGQRQRICIARALAVKPKFIICDEPVSSLDVSVQAEILNLLIKLKEEFGLTYIFISHDLSVVKFISDRVAVMQFGKLLEIGPATEIYRNPRTEYTRKLIDSIPGAEFAKISLYLS